jgi:hypothetical protein
MVWTAGLRYCRRPAFLDSEQMHWEFWQSLHAGLLSPLTLFFCVGVVAALVKSGLRFPEALSSSLTLYLLVSVGFEGGVGLREVGIRSIWKLVLGSIAVSAAIPIWTFPALRWVGRVGASDSAAISAHYGSVSIITYLVSAVYMRQLHVFSEDYTAAIAAVMASPGIIVGAALGRWRGMRAVSQWFREDWIACIREVMTSREFLLLSGALVAGAASAHAGAESMSPFFTAAIPGVLALMLIEMGLAAAMTFPDIRRAGWAVVIFGIVAPVCNAGAILYITRQHHVGPGTATALAVLAASASCSAAPTAIRVLLPAANPARYVTAALGVTLPFNLLVGLPLYFATAQRYFPDQP